MNDNFYQRIRQARIEADLKQEFIAKELNIPVSAVSAIENGNRKIDIFEMAKLANLYKKNINWFLDLSDDKKTISDYNKNPALETAYSLIEQASPELKTAVAYAIIGFLKHGNLLNNDKK